MTLLATIKLVSKLPIIEELVWRNRLLTSFSASKTSLSWSLGNDKNALHFARCKMKRNVWNTFSEILVSCMFFMSNKKII